jgi:hydroxymethylpyrimidine/phosphomethylpyrimidine kinase
LSPTLPVALTIAGSDPSGGAGIQADLKTFHQFGVYGEAVITLVTVQNTLRLDRVECLNPELVIAQLRAVIEDIPPRAAKTGALGNAAILRAVAHEPLDFPLVVDPVMISKHGAQLIAADARQALIDELLPRAFLLTPNIPEAESITGIAIPGLDEMHRAAERLVAMGARNVLVKGGHLEGRAVDVLLAGGRFHKLAAERIATPNTHGTGCTFSAAITAELAKGSALLHAVAHAKRYITEAIRTNPGLGAGAGPVNHHAAGERSRRPAPPRPRAESRASSDPTQT